MGAIKNLLIEMTGHLMELEAIRPDYTDEDLEEMYKIYIESKENES